MYDIALELMTCNKPKYLKRLVDFKKIGLLNVGTTKVLVKLMVGTDEMPKKVLFEGWPAGVEVEVVRSPGDTVVNKIFHMYSILTEADLKKARWFARLDDDSINDIQGLVSNLDLEFDSEREFYITTLLSDDYQEEEWRLAQQLGYGRWYAPFSKPCFHEWECAIISNAAFSRIIKTPDSMKYFAERANNGHGYGDHGFALAARMAKIYAVAASFLTQEPRIGRLSSFGGIYNHVHYIAHDIEENAGAYSVASKLLTPGAVNDPEPVSDRRYVITTADEGMRIVKFNQNHTIENGNEMCFWFKTDIGDIQILNDVGQVIVNLKSNSPTCDALLGVGEENRTFTFFALVI
jgi:hypothetical protein